MREVNKVKTKWLQVFTDKMTHENCSSSLKPDYLVPTTGLRETCSENQDSQAAREGETKL